MASLMSLFKIENYNLIFSFLYIVRSFRNSNIDNITYLESFDYSTNFNKKIYKNGDIVYIKNWNTLDESIKKKYQSNQKWKIVYFYEDNGFYSYDIKPYFIYFSHYIIF